jgi:hypothetical protein
LFFDLRLSGSNRHFEFDKRGQLFICAHNEALTVAFGMSSLMHWATLLFYSRSLDAVIRVHDENGNVIEAHE